MKTIAQPHCQQCGSTNPENVDTMFDPELQGYTACCNERVVGGYGATCDADECSHS